MRHGVLAMAVLVTMTADTSAQAGITYQFREDTLVGTVWAAGDNARREIDSEEGGTAAGRVEIWKNGGDRIQLTSGHPEVNTVVAERLASLEGMPVARMLEVTRRIETGDAVSATSVLLLSEVREATVAPDRFEVPADYRFQEPVTVPPNAAVISCLDIF